MHLDLHSVRIVDDSVINLIITRIKNVLLRRKRNILLMKRQLLERNGIIYAIAYSEIRVRLIF